MGRCISFIIASLLLASSAWAQGSTTIRDGNGDGVADVLNTTPAGTEYGIVVRPIGGGAGGGDGALLDGVSAAIKATVFDFPNSNPLGVVLRDTNGDYVSVGGGTQYSQGDAATNTDVLTMAGCVRADTAAVAAGVADGDRARCIVDSIGRLWSHIGTIDGGTITTITNPVAVTGTFWQATQPVSGTVAVSNSFVLDATYTGRMPAGASPADNESNTNTALSRIGTFTYVFDGAAWDRWTGAVSQSGTWNVTNISGTVSLPTGAATLAEQQTQTTALQLIDNIVSGNGVNITQFGGTNVSIGTGASGAGIPRVTVANDSNILATQSGTWNIGTVTTLTGITNALPTGSNTLGAVTGTAADNSANSSLKLPVLAARANTSAPSWTDNLQVPLSVDLAGNLRVNSTGGGAADGTTFTENSTTFSAAGGLYNDGIVPLTSGKEYAARITAYRAIYTTQLGTDGLERGTVTNPLNVSMTNFGAIIQQSSLLDPRNQPNTVNITTMDQFGNLKAVSQLTDGQHFAALRGPEGAQAFDYGLVVQTGVGPSLQCPYVFPINQTASTQVVTNPGGRWIHVCGFQVVSAGAQNVSLVEGTGSTCATASKGLYGGTTASAAFPANGGGGVFSDRIMVPMQVLGDNLCLLQSAANNVSGSLVYGIY